MDKNLALETLKSFVKNTDNIIAKDAILTLHPELAESEEERIRESLITYLSNELHNVKQLTPRTNEFESWISLLEKQKEQKPAEWSEEDERLRLACIATIDDVIDYERDRWEDYNPGRPFRPITKYDEQIDWLKSLPERFSPQPHWKPSEEQMKALRYVAYHLMPDTNYRAEMFTLYNELKKHYGL